MTVIVGYVGIKGALPLDETAAALSAAFGVTFEEERTGRFEEYPAYVAQALGMELALLGIPDPAFDIRSNQTNDFELQIFARPDSSGDDTLDLSVHLDGVIRRKTSLECWVLK